LTKQRRRSWGRRSSLRGWGRHLARHGITSYLLRKSSNRCPQGSGSCTSDKSTNRGALMRVYGAWRSPRH